MPTTNQELRRVLWNLGKNGTSREIDNRVQGTYTLSQRMDYISSAETMLPSGKGSFPVPTTPEPRLEGHEAKRNKALWEERF